jgi:RNase adaptor protein for sRNA GlmZ degradation
MLNIRIYSFSYKRSGIPKDITMNGGGFVFDCRYIENPGRIPSFMTLNGKDKEVIYFLDMNEQMTEFLENVYNIVDRAIENYLSRDFIDLMVSFGCTGGQHRSVYSAEKLKRHLENKFNGNINIQINHNELEQGKV